MMSLATQKKSEILDPKKVVRIRSADPKSRTDPIARRKAGIGLKEIFVHGFFSYPQPVIPIYSTPYLGDEF